MPQIRFATARSLLEVFPELAKRLSVAPGAETPIEFLEKLSAQEKFEDAVAFCAHVLPRREAVWWACGSVKTLVNEPGKPDGLQAAEAWVYDPSDQNRDKALAIGTRGDSAIPFTWLALGAGWSGGMLSSHPKAPVPMPPYLTARAARIAITLSALGLPPQERSSRLRACVAEGIKLAESGL